MNKEQNQGIPELKRYFVVLKSFTVEHRCNESDAGMPNVTLSEAYAKRDKLQKMFPDCSVIRYGVRMQRD